MDFSTALRFLKEGCRIRRSDWEEGEYLFLKDSIIYLFWDDRDWIEELISKDLLATDWEVM